VVSKIVSYLLGDEREHAGRGKEASSILTIQRTLCCGASKILIVL
jgi:hypothetical protein